MLKTYNLVLEASFIFPSHQTMAPTLSEFPPPSLRPILAQVTTLLKSRTETVSIAETVTSLLCFRHPF